MAAHRRYSSVTRLRPDHKSRVFQVNISDVDPLSLCPLPELGCMTTTPLSCTRPPDVAITWNEPPRTRGCHLGNVATRTRRNEVRPLVGQCQRQRSSRRIRPRSALRGHRGRQRLCGPLGGNQVHSRIAGGLQRNPQRTDTTLADSCPSRRRREIDGCLNPSR